MSRRGRKQRERERRQRRAERRSAAGGAPQRSARRTSAADPKRGVDPFDVLPDLHWYIARAYPRMATRALNFLTDRGYHAFQLRSSDVVVRRGRRVVRQVPLLEGLVFIGLDTYHCLDRVCGYHGIAEILSHPSEDGGLQGNISGPVLRPARLDPEALQNFVDAVALSEIVQPVGVKVGDQVIVCDGPFATFPAVVEEILPADKVKVGVAIFGRSSPCVLGIAEIQAVA